MLEGLLPKILPAHIVPRYIIFEGKTDLEKNLSRKLRTWLNPRTKFVILRDQDSGNCTDVKNNLVRLCNQAGKPNTLVRIACRELESWYIGDLKAVENGLGLSGLAKQQDKQKFRNPDMLNNAYEELSKVTTRKYQKVSGSRATGPYLDKKRNCSQSFQVFVTGIETVVSEIIS
ncbi:DUF4276 family protein [Leptolyngbya cf. ectocarpi LEGE 11479]|uniref:DUF4276 family protein n=2 Tax=Leptolyngbya ectocarpi TaxID=1202 RepID=A0A928X3Y6_LEPEC|nr:DUF4276 family protein [Leptolyngbya cf. ectocarpi LEGE 11479]